jgi:hypothetical protein
LRLARSADELSRHQLGGALAKLKTFNARRKFRAAVRILVAISRTQNLVAAAYGARRTIEAEEATQADQAALQRERAKQQANPDLKLGVSPSDGRPRRTRDGTRLTRGAQQAASARCPMHAHAIAHAELVVV